ncbi:cytosine permease [Hymenobacter humi]|uniref:Cytosine permease n=1 Tax=Hymenobacter humi TaxID=1411620 RepID=A0ABW2U1L1_9BACT
MPDLYQYHGRYAYRNGFNLAAIVALIVGILPNVPGFLTAIGVLDKGAVWPGLVAVYNYAWFVGFLVSGGVYMLLMHWQSASRSADLQPGIVARPAPSSSLAQ